MRELDIQQNTTEWEDFRRLHVGASDIPIILGKSPYKKSSQLWEEKVLGKRGYYSKAMQDGHDLEPQARMWANNLDSCQYQPKTYLHDNNWLMASVDGFDEPSGRIIEIKHPNEKMVEMVDKGDIPDHYIYQMQAQMYVLDKNQVFLVIPKPGYKQLLETGQPVTYNTITIHRNEDMIEEIEVAGSAFYKSMLEFSPPEPQISDFVEREDSEWSEAAKAWLKAKETLETAKEYEAICKDSLKYLAGSNSVKGSGVTVSRYMIKGQVDYSKIPEIKEVDLNKYRKAPSEGWRFTAV